MEFRDTLEVRFPQTLAKQFKSLTRIHYPSGPMAAAWEALKDRLILEEARNDGGKILDSGKLQLDVPVNWG